MTQPRLGRHARKHQRHARPLHPRQPLPVPHHAQHHREHLARDGDGHEHQAAEALQRGEDEELADCARDAEAEDVVEDGGVAGDECEGGAKVGCGGGGCGDVEEGGEEEPGCLEEEAEEVGRDHHLGARDGAVAVRGFEDVVLDCVC